MATLGLIVAAGGFGTRLGADGPKQYIDLLGRPMLERTVGALAACDAVDILVVVVNPEDVDFCREQVLCGHYAKVSAVVGGGSQRAFSVRNGLEALAQAGGVDLVGTHDGARPLITCAEVSAVRRRLMEDPALSGAVLALPSVDTVKVVDSRGVIRSTPERRTLWRAQTPQVFRWPALRAAYAQPDEVLSAATDDAALVEAMGGEVAVVEGSVENLKITTPLDIRVAEAIIAGRER